MNHDLKTPNPVPWRAAERARQACQEAQMEALMRSLKRLFLIALCMPFLGLAVYKWEQHRDAQVVSRSSIGTLLHLRPVHSPRGFKPVVLLLKTSTGFVALRDPLNLPVGSALVQEHRASGRAYVCDARRTQCAQVAQAATPGYQRSNTAAFEDGPRRQGSNALPQVRMLGLIKTLAPSHKALLATFTSGQHPPLKGQFVEFGLLPVSKTPC